MLPSGRPLYKTYFNEIICGRLQNGVARVLVVSSSLVYTSSHPYLTTFTWLRTAMHFSLASWIRNYYHV